MSLEKIHQKLHKECPPKYQINEIIPFAYPYRIIKIKATVSKNPEKSLQQIYSTLLQTIKSGYSEKEQIIKFLGLHPDDFILRELYFLRERGYVNLVSEKWLITDEGEKFIKDNSVLSIIEKEDFEFLIDGINGDIVKRFTYEKNNIDNELPSEINFLNKSPELLKGKHEYISDIYKQEHNDESYLIDYEEDNILFDKKCWHNYFLIEYHPTIDNKEQIDPYIEIRNNEENFSLEKRVTKILDDKYPSIIYELSLSDRKTINKIEQEDDELSEALTTTKKTTSNSLQNQTLSIWQTQEKFSEALKTVKSKILIESPWIKRATLKYIEDFEKALKKKINLYILYGIEEEDSHHQETVDEMKKLEKKYSQFFHLIHLPTHFKKIANEKMTGTHRKLLIKDEDYYIAGSFNFLSFNKKEGQKIANEESILIPTNVKNKWEQVKKEYKLK